jgi:predicted nucleic acid-binding protein
VILTDTGPLIALIDQDEEDHVLCITVMASVRLPLVITWPVLAEAMYLLGNTGWRAQEALWRLILGGDVQLGAIDGSGLARMHALMEQYRDTPMDLADASLIVLAEQRNFTRIFTLDSHFHAYRRHGRQRLEVIP